MGLGGGLGSGTLPRGGGGGCSSTSWAQTKLAAAGLAPMMPISIKRWKHKRKALADSCLVSLPQFPFPLADHPQKLWMVPVSFKRRTWIDVKSFSRFQRVRLLWQPHASHSQWWWACQSTMGDFWMDECKKKSSTRAMRLRAHAGLAIASEDTQIN